MDAMRAVLGRSARSRSSIGRGQCCVWFRALRGATLNEPWSRPRPENAIRLDPERLANPDLELRYALPNKLEKVTQGRVRDDAYDYSNARVSRDFGP